MKTKIDVQNYEATALTNFGKITLLYDYDRIKIYDSNGEYFDYLGLANSSNVKKSLQRVLKEISKIKTLDEFIEYFGHTSYTVSKNLIDLGEDVYGLKLNTLIEENGVNYILDELSKNEFINKFGDNYVFADY